MHGPLSRVLGEGVGGWGGSFGHHVGCVVFVFPWRPTYLCGFLLAVLIIEATCSVHHVTGCGYNRVGGLER